MPRLFTGLEIPAALRAHLSLIRAHLPGAKWVAEDNMHITLRFVGDIDDRTADEFAMALGGICAEPFTVSIRSTGAFGGREPRVLWAGVERGAALDALYRANERAARSAGLPPDPRPFRPHVTLARLRGTRHAAVARFLEENGALHAEPYVAERFVLFSARPGSGGGPYGVEAEYPFASEGDWAMESAEIS